MQIKSRYSIISFVTSLILILILASCSLKKIPVEDLTEPKQITKEIITKEILLERINDKNDQLESFKSIGKIDFKDNNMLFKERIAMMGQLPDKLRIEILGIIGSVMTLTCDGETVYFVSRYSKGIYKQRASSADLSRLIPIYITPIEILSYMVGRVPLKTYFRSQLIEENQSYVIVLKRFFGTSQKIIFDQEGKNIVGVEIYKGLLGRLAYRVRFENIRKVNQFEIPFRIVITTDAGTVCILEQRMFQSNVQVKDNQFVIE